MHPYLSCQHVRSKPPRPFSQGPYRVAAAITAAQETGCQAAVGVSTTVLDKVLAQPVSHNTAVTRAVSFLQHVRQGAMRQLSVVSLQTGAQGAHRKCLQPSEVTVAEAVSSVLSLILVRKESRLSIIAVCSPSSSLRLSK